MSLCDYLSSEGRPHYNTEQDFSNPRYVDWIFIPPTFITTKKIENIDEDYNIEKDFLDLRYVNQITIPPTFIVYNTITKKIENIDEVKDYLSELFNDKTEDFVNQVLELALDKMKDDLDLSIKEAIELAINEITVVYGGSASDVIDGGTDP